ncbi:MAG: hypothetical protein R3C59_19920 [Planctomycetaceae bacterium]
MVTSSDNKAHTETAESGAAPVSNTVAVIGLILIGVATAMCVLLFAMARQLPSPIVDFQKAADGTPAQLRLLILGCSTAVLVMVAFVLCAVGMFLPNRPRLAAAVGTVLSLLLLLGVFGVLLVGVLMNAGV